MKKEYEVVAEISNACAGSGRPQVYMEEVELENPDEYVRMKHGRDWDQMKKEVLPSGCTAVKDSFRNFLLSMGNSGKNIRVSTHPQKRHLNGNPSRCLLRCCSIP